MNPLFLVTVDCDMRCDSVRLRQQSLDVLLEVFGEFGVDGHATWYLNENDFDMTTNHESFLSEALRRGDTLGVHDHLESFDGRYERGPVRDFCRRSKERVEAWLAANGAARRIAYHRNGCALQDATVYGAVQDLGYTVVSELHPGKSGTDRADHPAYDNTQIPIGIPPYRHDAANFTQVDACAGAFLHFPLMQMFMKDLDYERMDGWMREFERKHIEPAVLLWVFHPYEIIEPYESLERPGATSIDPRGVEVLRSHLRKLKSEYGVRFVSVEECAKEIEEQRSI